MKILIKLICYLGDLGQYEGLCILGSIGFLFCNRCGFILCVLLYRLRSILGPRLGSLLLLGLGRIRLLRLFSRIRKRILFLGDCSLGILGNFLSKLGIILYPVYIHIYQLVSDKLAKHT